MSLGSAILTISERMEKEADRWGDQGMDPDRLRDYASQLRLLVEAVDTPPPPGGCDPFRVGPIHAPSYPGDRSIGSIDLARIEEVKQAFRRAVGREETEGSFAMAMDGPEEGTMVSLGEEIPGDRVRVGSSWYELRSNGKLYLFNDPSS